MNSPAKNRIKGHIAPLIASAVMGTGFAVLAIISQGGCARGYTSVVLLFVSAGLSLLGLIAGIAALALGKLGTALEIIASAIILPTAFLLTLFVIRSFNGE